MKRKAVLLLPAWSRDRIYGPEAVAEMSQLVDLTDCAELLDTLYALRPVLADTEVILSGWGMVTMDSDFLDAAPRLKAVIYGAGSVRYFLTDEFWERNILLTSAWAANGIPVVEYTLAAITFGLKKALLAADMTRREKTFRTPAWTVGLYGAKVGVIGAGVVGAGVLRRLRDYEVETFCYDPYLCPHRARELWTTPMGLDEIFRTCDAVSLHAASIPATEHMITGAHFRSMKEGAVFINTARGRIVKEDEMTEELQKGRVFAFLDVTDPEPPEPGSPLYSLPNVLLTPHLAGPEGAEVRRNGQYVIEELRRYLAGEEPRYPVTKEMMEWMA
jgi:phosphoglycerate dehydrogenase-like enzyme